MEGHEAMETPIREHEKTNSGCSEDIDMNEAQEHVKNSSRNPMEKGVRKLEANLFPRNNTIRLENLGGTLERILSRLRPSYHAAKEDHETESDLRCGFSIMEQLKHRNSKIEILLDTIEGKLNDLEDYI